MPVRAFVKGIEAKRRLRAGGISTSQPSQPSLILHSTFYIYISEGYASIAIIVSPPGFDEISTF